MKCRCLNCAAWIIWRRAEGEWVHLGTGESACIGGRSVAARDVRLPLVDLTDSDRALIDALTHRGG